MDINKYEILKRLPKHLHKYIVDQNYYSYNAEDHAVWRYMMRISYYYLSQHAHQSYVEGLKKTGIGVEEIPNIDEMNETLKKIGWGAVCVDGFIPPTAFMEFQAYHVLVIAADIRNIKHIDYTPAPDIFHEAAGHAPIISDKEYAEYLRLFGAIGSRAISSKRDNELYEAIRQLSILKEREDSTEEEIKLASDKVVDIQKNMGEMSEMAMIRNLHWWTVEYGLIGSIDDPRIYGAGLLSSIGESVNCLKPHVKKIPYSIKAASYSFDITTQQPQLFVTPSFSHLTVVLNEFADTMALRKGGPESVEKAINSNDYATCELSSGLQISGVFTNQILDDNGNIAYLQTTGPSMLCEREKLVIGHDFKAHADGYGTVVGRLKDENKNIENMTLKELSLIGISTDDECILEFESGVVVNGNLHYIRKNKYGKVILMSFENCTVTYGDKILFSPEWGIYDMGVGESVVSVFAGVADQQEVESKTYISPTKTNKNTELKQELLYYYKKVKAIRTGVFNKEKLDKLYKKLIIDFPDDWLVSIEIYELYINNNLTLNALHVKEDLLSKAKNMDELCNKLIVNGLWLVDKYAL
jgi:phenylalanine-4-hydroxylase